MSFGIADGRDELSQRHQQEIEISHLAELLQQILRNKVIPGVFVGKNPIVSPSICREELDASSVITHADRSDRTVIRRDRLCTRKRAFEGHTRSILCLACGSTNKHKRGLTCLLVARSGKERRKSTSKRREETTSSPQRMQFLGGNDRFFGQGILLVWAEHTGACTHAFEPIGLCQSRVFAQLKLHGRGLYIEGSDTMGKSCIVPGKVRSHVSDSDTVPLLWATEGFLKVLKKSKPKNGSQRCRNPAKTKIECAMFILLRWSSFNLWEPPCLLESHRMLGVHATSP